MVRGFLAWVVLFTGCYQHHELTPQSDAAQPDAGVDAAPPPQACNDMVILVDVTGSMSVHWPLWPGMVANWLDDKELTVTIMTMPDRVVHLESVDAPTAARYFRNFPRPGNSYPYPYVFDVLIEEVFPNYLGRDILVISDMNSWIEPHSFDPDVKHTQMCTFAMKGNYDMHYLHGDIFSFNPRPGVEACASTSRMPETFLDDEDLALYNELERFCN